MSREWGLHCKTCDSCSVNDFNHGERLLRSVVKGYPHIKALRDAIEGGYLDVSIMGYSSISDELFTWLAEHHAHELELRDEYGDCESLEEPLVSVSPCALPLHQPARKRDELGCVWVNATCKEIIEGVLARYHLPTDVITATSEPAPKEQEQPTNELGECEECGGPCRWEYAD